MPKRTNEPQSLAKKIYDQIVPQGVTVTELQSFGMKKQRSIEKLISSYAMNMQGITFALSLSAAIAQGKKQLNGLMDL
jgi:hypothetical protein